MPNPNTRARPRSASTASMISGSFPMKPSVQNTTMRSRRGSSGGGERGAHALEHLRPAAALEPASHAFARAIADGVAGSGASLIACAAPSNATTWNVSSGPIASSARATSARTRSNGAPIIEPDLSTRNTSSFGRTSAGAISAGGWTNSMRKSSPFSRCTTACAAGTTPAGRHVRTKSLFGIRSSSASATSRAPPGLEAGDDAVAARSRRRRRRSPGTSRTRMSTSCPERVPGATTGGVTREASGTRSVSGEVPWPPHRGRDAGASVSPGT